MEQETLDNKYNSFDALFDIIRWPQENRKSYLLFMRVMAFLRAANNIGFIKSVSCYISPF